MGSHVLISCVKYKFDKRINLKRFKFSVFPNGNTNCLTRPYFLVLYLKYTTNIRM